MLSEVVASMRLPVLLPFVSIVPGPVRLATVARTVRIDEKPVWPTGPRSLKAAGHPDRPGNNSIRKEGREFSFFSLESYND
jgi:hypothetical protein